MKIIRILFIAVLVFVMSNVNGQIKVAADGKVGMSSVTNPQGELHIRNDNAGPSSFIVEKTPNFVRAAAGAAGSAFYFNLNTFFAISPGDNIADNSVDQGNLLVVRGPGGANGGNVGVGTLTPSCKLDVAGAICSNGVQVTSDRRLKQDVTSFSYGLNEVLQLNPIQYTYNGKGGTTAGTQHVGLYAQELQSVVPELVTEYVHETFVDEVDLTKELPATTQETFLRIKDNEVKYLLINAIKEQQNKISDLEARIAQLESLISKK